MAVRIGSLLAIGLPEDKLNSQKRKENGARAHYSLLFRSIVRGHYRQLPDSWAATPPFLYGHYNDKRDLFTSCEEQL